MTRINLVNPIELSDQHLLAEYRELPRIVNAVINNRVIAENIPDKFCLGKGHIKFFYNKIFFLASRYKQIYDELIYRGFSLNSDYSYENMHSKIKSSFYKKDKNFIVSDEELDISRQRLIEKYCINPLRYKWTKRKKPDYYNNLNI